MLPDEVYKRRPNHNNTPESIILIVTNYIVFAVATQLFAACTKIGTFFWVIIAALALYNFFNIRKNREDYGKPQVIAYVISVAGMFLLFFLMRNRELSC
jgi:threonine/homoserine efflux transporter RhtA